MSESAQKERPKRAASTGTKSEEAKKLRKSKDGEEAHHKVVENREEWSDFMAKQIVKEKELTRKMDEVNQLRKQVPWLQIDKPYSFEGPNGKKFTLSGLFDDQDPEKPDLLVYHLMYDPSWDKACNGCIEWTEHLNYLYHASLKKYANVVAVARAPYAKLEALKKAHKWTLPIYSSFDSDFNKDLGVENTVFNSRKNDMKDQPFKQLQGASAFRREKAADGSVVVYQTYNTTSRGIEKLHSFFGWVDILPEGRGSLFPTDM